MSREDSSIPFLQNTCLAAVLWKLSGGRRLESKYSVSPSIFLESLCFQHSDLPYLDSPCIPSSETPCLLSLGNKSLLSFTAEEVKWLHGMGRVGVEARETTCFYTLSANPPAPAPPLLSLPEIPEAPVPDYALCPQVPLGVSPQEALQVALSALSASSATSPSQVLLFLPLPSSLLCVSGFQEERELSICVQFASLNSKAILVLSPSCSGDSFKHQMSDPIPELSRSCGWLWGEERTFIMLCVIYKQAHVHTRVHIQPNSSLYII